MHKKILLIAFSFFSCFWIRGQEKQVNNNVHSWLGLLTTYRLNNHWGAVGDVLIRREVFVEEPGFYMVRAGGGYWFNNNVALTGAYSNLWLYQRTLTNESFTTEYRFDVQLSLSNQLGSVSTLNRFRFDSRWREVVVNNQTTGNYTFSERIRYLFSCGIPVSSNPKVPVITLTTEALIQFGEQIVNNPLDQLRGFAGIRQQLGKGWSCDCGYMLIYQQPAAGNVRNLNHTIRLLFYFVKGPKTIPETDLQPLMDE